MADEAFERRRSTALASDGGIETFRGGGSETDLSVDTITDLLLDKRRRCILRFFYLRAREQAQLTTLVDHIQEWEAELGRSTPREAIEVTLRHQHLPKLEEASVVRFDDSTGSIEYHESGRLERFVSLAIEECPVP